jgi:hypothetical protein
MSNSKNFLESETEQLPAEKAKLHCDALSSHHFISLKSPPPPPGLPRA